LVRVSLIFSPAGVVAPLPGFGFSQVRTEIRSGWADAAGIMFADR